MSNPWGYNELYMHSQRDPADLCKQIKLGNSGLSIWDAGCYIADMTWLSAKKHGHNLEIFDVVNKMNAIGGFPSGYASWSAIKKILDLTVSLTPPRWPQHYSIIQQVYVQGTYRMPDGHVVQHAYTHWVTVLSGGLMYDPLRGGGQFVHKLDYYPAVTKIVNGKLQPVRQYVW